MINWSLGDNVCVDYTTVLKGGFYPLSVKGRPNAMRLHLGMPGLDRVGRGTIETDWDGEALNPPVQITTKPRATLEAAIEATICKWKRVVKYVQTGDLDKKSVRVAADQLMTVPHPASPQPPLEVGEYIAYLIPGIPAQFQSEFIITQVTDTKPFTLANGHHESVFKTGRGHVSRYDPVANRVVFPVVDIREVK